MLLGQAEFLFDPSAFVKKAAELHLSSSFCLKDKIPILREYLSKGIFIEEIKFLPSYLPQELLPVGVPQYGWMAIDKNCNSMPMGKMFIPNYWVIHAFQKFLPDNIDQQSIIEKLKAPILI